MMLGIKRLKLFLRSFRSSQDGGPSLEFALIFPGVILLVVAALELGFLMSRHVMMERGLDMAVRELRLNTGSPVNERQLKAMVCNAAGVLPNCMTNVRLELRPIDMFHSGPRSQNSIPRRASCTDHSDPFQPARNFQAGVSNQIMIVRACGTFAPLLPGMGLGAILAQGADGRYRLVSTTAFVMEPV